MNTPPPAPLLSPGEETEIRVMLARFEAKLDVALAQHGAKLEQHGQEIGEIRARVVKMEDAEKASPAQVEDLERRTRFLERTPTVSPKQLGAAFVAAVGVIATVSPLLERLYS